MTDQPAPTHAATAPSVILVRATGDEAAGAARKVAGLTVLERALRQLSRRPGTRLIIVTDGAMALPPRLPANVAVHPRTSDVKDAIASLLRSGDAAAPPVVVVAADVVRRHGDALAEGCRVVDETTRRRAEDGVFADLLRGDLGVIARHLNKKISFRITRHLLCKLPITPNQVTLGAGLIGLMGCLLIARGTYAGAVLGFLLAQAQSILDGCDGELARVRFQQSSLGEWLDTLVDDFLNLSLVVAMGVGLWRAGHGWPAACASATGAAMLLVYNAVSYRELVRQGVGGELLKIRWKLARGLDMKAIMSANEAHGGGSVLARAVLSLGRRDVFIFSWLVLATVRMLPAALLWADIIALSCFVTAAGQLLIADPPPGPINVSER